jgi:hypothetical protein
MEKGVRGVTNFIGVVLGIMLALFASVVRGFLTWVCAIIFEWVFPTSSGAFMVWIGADNISFPKLCLVLSFIGAVTFKSNLTTKGE